MGLKDEIKKDTQELKQDEELLVKVFKLEKFIRKYKKPIIAGIILLIAILIGYNTYNYFQTQKLIKTNNALDVLLKNPNNKEALKILKENKNLYNLYLLTQGKFNQITSKELKAIKAYELAMKKGTKSALESYLLNPDYKILKNPVRLALMRIYLKEHNRQKAKTLYSEIDPNSKFKELGLYLLHYGIVK